MDNLRMQKLTGALFIAGAILVNVPYTLLIMNFDYPDILRQPTGEILTRFAAGGTDLIWTWLAFAWLGLPILLGMLLLTPVIESFDDHPERNTLSRIALNFGVVGALAQIFGLLRWPFVVPVLADRYMNSTTSPAGREAIEAVFQALHQYGGVVLGEHIGQIFTIIWMTLISLSLLGRRAVPRWLPWSGFVASAFYLLAQAELLATAIPGFAYWAEAGLVGSLLWIAWMIALGVSLLSIRRRRREYTRENSGLGFSAVQ